MAVRGFILSSGFSCEFYKSLGCLAVTLIALTSIATAQVTCHEKWNPKGEGPFAVVIGLHTAGGFTRI